MTSIHEDKSNQARQALLDSATRLFAESGFHAVSNRKLADDAKVNQAMIAYYFGGKEGLYIGVFETMLDVITARLGPKKEQIEKQFQQLTHEIQSGFNNETRTQSLKLITQLMSAYTRLLMKPEFRSFAKLMMREQMEPTQAFKIVWESFHRPQLKMLSHLIGYANERKRPSIDDKLFVLTLIAQVVFFRIASATVANHMGWSLQLEPKNIQLLEKHIRKNIELVIYNRAETPN